MEIVVYLLIIGVSDMFKLLESKLLLIVVRILLVQTLMMKPLINMIKLLMVFVQQ